MSRRFQAACLRCFGGLLILGGIGDSVVLRLAVDGVAQDDALKEGVTDIRTE